MKNTKNRDFLYINRIKEHAYSALTCFSSITIEEFQDKDSNLRKSILFDLFQVGELVSKLSKELELSIDKADFVGIINVRNHIVHGYSNLNNDIIVRCLQSELSPFIEKLERNALIIYKEQIRNLMDKKVEVLVDKQSPLNIGHLSDINSPEGELQQVIIIDTNEPLYQCMCQVVGILNYDNVLYLLGSIVGAKYSNEEIKQVIENKLHYEDYLLFVK